MSAMMSDLASDAECHPAAESRGVSSARTPPRKHGLLASQPSTNAKWIGTRLDTHW